MIVISQTKKEEFGGFQKVEIIRKSDVLNCPAILTNYNAIDFTHKTTSDTSVLINPVGDTINIKASPKKTDQGTLYNIKCNFEIPYLDIAVDNFLEKYQNQEVILKAITNSNKMMLYGSLENPLEFFYEIIHTKKIETISKYVCSISRNISQKPVIAKI